MARIVRLLLVVAAAGAVLASRPGHGASAPRSVEARKDARAVPEVLLQPIATGLPDITSITSAGDGRLFLTLQRGQIVIWDGARVLPAPFLDLSSLLVCCGEQGLLSMAFHPNYAFNGLFFVNYTNLTGQTVVARYRVSSGNFNAADPSSAAILLTIDQPFTNHNGGQLQFGPDSDLYIGMGDGGSANDPFCNAQSSGTLLGKLLRIDVDQNVDRAPYYGIPPDNPYVLTTGPPEAWAYGVRNPWRFSFDRVTGDLYIGDVGQDAREEIDYHPLSSPGGQNYGWKIMEGSLCGVQGNSGCTVALPACGDPAYTLPIIEYTHDNGSCAVTGGYVYRGSAIPDLKGSYVFGDFCSGTMWAASRQGEAWSAVVLPITAPNLTTFGEDSAGELYVGTPGTLYQIVPPASISPTITSILPVSGPTRGGQRVLITGTNFAGGSAVRFGAVPAAVTVQSSTALVAVAPAHAPGAVDVTVENPGAAPAVGASAFTYVAIPRLLPPARVPHVVTR